MAIAEEEEIEVPDLDSVLRKGSEDERGHGSKGQEHGYEHKFDHGRRDVECRERLGCGERLQGVSSTSAFYILTRSTPRIGYNSI